MRTAETILDIIRERGKRGLPVEDLYRQMFNPDLFLLAYGKIYGNKGAMTPGVTTETVDEMSLDKIQAIIETVRYERYRWSPVRRVYIPKKNSDKKRPLGMPSWSDKLLQEVIRLLLEAYYEPQFSERSHGFRPQRGCHTALSEIRHHWKGTAWFIEGDIKGCFDNIDHSILLNILREKIQDNRFVRLIENLLKAGYLEDWKYNATYSGTPQGGIVSPILTNIYLDKFDQYVEQTLVPANDRGERRSYNSEYLAMTHRIERGRKRGEDVKELVKQRRNLPSLDTQDPTYRRLRYIRYADDFLLGFAGPRLEAETIKEQIGTFLKDQLNLEMSEDKTLITHGRTEVAHFLGYEIEIFQNDTRLSGSKHKRNHNGCIGLRLPAKVISEKCQGYMSHGKAIDRAEILNDTIFSIITRYQSEYRGTVEYYRLAYNLHRFDKLKWIMEQSLTKTLAHKLKVSVSMIYDKFQTTLQTKDGPRKGLSVTIERQGKKPLTAQWGGISLKWKKEAILTDEIKAFWNQRTELEERLLADTCELCGSTENVEVHHIRALKDLEKDGREKPEWMKVMAAHARKTLVTCRKCHRREIHPGRYDGPKLRK